MHRRWLVVSLVMALLVDARLAMACTNATMASAESIATLKDAESALDQGDVVTARDLAGNVRLANMDRTDGTEPLYDRALGVEALSYIRDPAASTEDLEKAVALLEARAFAEANPRLFADLGEAYERLGRDRDAVNTLAPLATADLMGSAYAYAALSRALGRRGDTAAASTYRMTCEMMAKSPLVCRGGYPRPPLLRGKPLGYALPGLVFLGGALLRRRKRGPSTAIWSTHRDAIFAASILVAAAVAFELAMARMTGWAVFASVVVVFAVGRLQRLAFLRAARRGEIPGFHVRPTEVSDEGAPLLRLAFGPKNRETVERLADPSYRESARSPVFRVERRAPHFKWLIAAFIVVCLLVGCTLTMFSRMSARVVGTPAPIPQELK